VYLLLPGSRSIVGQYDPGKTRDNMYINFHRVGLEGTKNNQADLAAVMAHEMVHSFKSLNIIDQDVPTAGAAGYYREFREKGTLGEADKLSRFVAGTKSTGADAIKLILKYRCRKVDDEPLESYDDGAELAGIIFQLFGKDDGSAYQYILALSIGLDHDSAMFAVKDQPPLLGLLLNFRRGEYLVLDEKRLNSDLEKLGDRGKRAAEYYLDELGKAYRVGLVPNKDVSIGSLPAPVKVSTGSCGQ
jgi:hypothetical protein